MTYTYNRSNHLAQTVPINTPLPGTFNPLLPLGATNGVFPYGYNAGNIYEYESRRQVQSEHRDGRTSTRGSAAAFRCTATTSCNTPKTCRVRPPILTTSCWTTAAPASTGATTSSLFGTIIGAAGTSASRRSSRLRSGSPYDVLLAQDIFGDDNGNVARGICRGPGAASSAAGL